MAGTRIGGLKAAAVNKKNDPLFYKKIGTKGGTTPTTKLKGFASDRKRASEAGRKGGQISRRKRTGVDHESITTE